MATIDSINRELCSHYGLVDPEERLLIGIILQHVEDAAFNDPKPRSNSPRIMAEWRELTARAERARRYVEDQEYEGICTLLGIDPEELAPSFDAYLRQERLLAA